MFIEKQSRYLPFVFISLIILGLIILVSSRSSDGNKKIDGPTTEISFSSNNMPYIELGHYTLWGVNENNERLILKRFNYFNNQLISLNTQELDSILLDGEFSFDKYEISVEPNGDRDEEQSRCVLMSGSNKDGTVNFDLNMDFSNASGQFVLATPTDGTNSTNELSGIWFTDQEQGNNTLPKLNLPELDECWSYSGYVKFRDTYLRMGQFSESNEADDFSEYSAVSPTSIQIPQIPGEDFLRNLPEGLAAPINLSNNNTQIIISLEPQYSFTRLYLDYQPFLEILNYTFDSSQNENPPYNLNQINIPIDLTVKVQLNDNNENI